MDKSDLSVGITLFDQIAVPFHKNELNKMIYEVYKDNDFYTTKGNKHRIYNKYKDELIEMETHFTYILVKTNSAKKNVFQNLF